MLTKVISGGQSGADRAGLIAGKACNLQTGGMMPKGFKALDGLHPEFAEMYGMKENQWPTYPQRTRWNVGNADGTVRIATDFNSAGEVLTLKLVRELGKPYFDVDVVQCMETLTTAEKIIEFTDWVWKMGIETLNVAGNSERTSPGIQEWARKFLFVAFNDVLRTQKALKEIYVARDREVPASCS